VETSAQRIADLYIIKMAAREATSTREFRRRRAAVRDLTAEVMEAFAEGFYLPMHEGRVAFGGILGKLRDLTKLFTKKPRIWENFKKAIGIESLSDLPGAIKQAAKDGYAALKRILGKVFSTWPLMLYTLPEAKLFSVNGALGVLIKQFPAFESYLEKNVRPRVDAFDEWFRKALPRVSTVVLVAAFFFIWWNVVEFEWDVDSLGSILLGQITLSDLLGSLPGSAVGFLLKGFGFGTFTLFPAALIARLLFLMGKRYLVWTGRGFRIDWDRLSKDRMVSGEPPPEVAALT